MKIKSFAFAAIVALASVACTSTTTTSIKGVFNGNDAPAKVQIIVGNICDTIVNVENNKFAVKVPVALDVNSVVSAGQVKAHFVSDGTHLTFTFNDDNTVDIKSNSKKSIQAKTVAFHQSLKDIQAEYDAAAASIQGDETKMDSLYNALMEKFQKINEEAFTKNKNNIIAVTALENLNYFLPLEQTDSLISTLDSALLKNPSVARIKSVIDAEIETGEGKMFKDFEVEGVKLSDYVGKGKYMLVDFWASWCGPCKAEIPNVKNVYDKYAGEDFDVLSVAVWDKPQASIDTAAARGINWNQIVNAQNVPTDLYGIQGIPHIILFGPDGTILKRDLREGAIEEEVAKYVQPKK